MTARGLTRVSVGGAALLGSLVVTAVATAATAIPDGFYEGLRLMRFATADVQFTVTDRGTAVPRLVLGCVSHETLYNGGAPGGLTTVTAPALTIRAGRLTYQGSAAVRPPGTYTIGAHAPLKLTLHHVSGPVVHYTYRGRSHAERTAWEGTVSSPVCSVAGARRVLLFGPMSGA